MMAGQRCGPAQRSLRALGSRSWLLLGLALAVPLAGQVQVDRLPDLWRGVVGDYAERIARDVETDAVGSISTGVILEGSVVWARGFGWADRDRKIAADAETIYRTGSISKSFTAALTMLLVEAGQLNWDDAVTEHLPAAAGFRDRSEGAVAVTLRHLGSHTSGLAREPRLAEAASGPIEGWEDKILASIPTTSFDALPGARYSYSNIGYGVLGLSVARAAGRPFRDLVEEMIFQPLGMRSSTFVIDDRLQDRLSTGYQRRRDGSIDAEQPALEHAGRGYKVPNGGIYSTVGDLGRFMAAVSGHLPLFTEAGREELVSVQTPEDPERGYGLGFSLSRDEDGRLFVGHGGSVAGYNAHMLFEPESGIGIVLLRNYSGGRTNLGRAARDLLTAILRASDHL